MEIVFIIDDLVYPEFKKDFLRERPIPPDSSMSEDEWVKEWGRLQYLTAAERGKRIRYLEDMRMDSNIIRCKN